MIAQDSLTRPSESGVLPKHRQSIGLYLHVPFCLQKCPYCSFYSLPGRLDLSKRYVAAIKKQIRRFAAHGETTAQPLATIFFGGGTPSILPPDSLRELLQDCLHNFQCAREMEVSIEVNPATVDGQGVQALRQAGFNRLSIGVQSFNNRELKLLGRPHSAADAVQTVQMARQAGFTNTSLDLMYGLPGQNMQTWQDNLQQALELQPEHLSLYELTIEENTPFAHWLTQGHLDLPDEETILSMMEQTGQDISAAGFARYEISNYARPGYQCRHNINYWKNGSYIGMGPGAVSCLAGTRFAAIADVEQFCDLLESDQDIWLERETLANETRFRETVIMGLRMTQGVSLRALAERFDINAVSYYGETLNRLMAQDLLEIQLDRLRLTAQGLLLADAVMADLV